MSGNQLCILDDPVVKSTAEKCNKSPAQVVLRHALQKGLIVIPKSASPSRIKVLLNQYFVVCITITSNND